MLREASYWKDGRELISGDRVKVVNPDSKYYNKTGTVDDFENLKLRGKDNLVLIILRNGTPLWFFCKELERCN